MPQTVNNIPIQMISVCSTLGDMTPLRFRFEDEEHQIITVAVDSVLSRKEIHRNGIHEIIYICNSIIDDTGIMSEIKYNVLSHKWTLLQRCAYGTAHFSH